MTQKAIIEKYIFDYSKIKNFRSSQDDIKEVKDKPQLRRKYLHFLLVINTKTIESCCREGKTHKRLEWQTNTKIGLTSLSQRNWNHNMSH